MYKITHRYQTLMQLIKELGGDAKVEEKFGVSASYLSQIRNKNRSFGERAAANMAKKLNLDPDYFDKAQSLNVGQKTIEYKSEVKNTFPRVIGTAKMGDGGYYFDLDGGDGFIEVYCKPDSIAIQVRGDSMYPAIKDSWYVIVEPHAQPQIDEYVLISFKDGRKMVKELSQIKDDCYVLTSVNGGGRMTAMKHDIEQFQAISMTVPPSKFKNFLE